MAKLATHIRRLNSHNRLIGWELRRMAVHALVKDGSAEAMNALADTLVSVQDHQHFKLVEKTLLELAEAGRPEARDAFCRLLIRHKHPLAVKLIFGEQYTPSDPELEDAFVKSLVTWILNEEWVDTGYSPQDAFHLLRKMTLDGSSEAREALCDLVTTHAHPQAREYVLSLGYAPRNPYQRAIFYVLTEQWEEYERFDFTRKLLPTAYKIADEALQDRLVASVRQGGRADILASLVAGDLSTSGRSDRDWAAIIGFWRQHKRWADLWKLLETSPVRWGMGIMTILLHEAHWSPKQEAECELFERLTPHTPSDAPATSDGWLVPCLAVLPDYADLITCFSFTISGYILAYSYSGDTLRLWALPEEVMLKHLRRLASMRTGGQLQGTYRHRMSLNTLQGHRSNICCLSIDSKNMRLASGDEDGIIYIWSAGGGLKAHFLRAHVLRVNCLCFSVGGRFLLSSGDDHTIRFWELHSEVCLRKIQQPDYYSLCLALHPNNRLIVSGDSDLAIRVWLVSSGELLHTFQGHSAPLTCLAISPDGTFLLSGSEDCSIKLWDLATGELMQSFSGHEAGMTQIIISPDGRFFVSASRDRTLRIWELPDGRLVKVFAKHSYDTTCIALDPEGRMLLRADSNRTVSIWAINRIDAGSLCAQQIRARELSLIQERLQEKEASEGERRYLNFLLEMLRWQKRFDIEIGEIEREAPYQQFDIEIA